MTLTPDKPAYGHYALTGSDRRLLSLAQNQQTSWLGRRLALIARRLVLSGRTQPIDAEAEGLRLRVHAQAQQESQRKGPIHRASHGKPLGSDDQLRRWR